VAAREVRAICRSGVVELHPRVVAVSDRILPAFLGHGRALPGVVSVHILAAPLHRRLDAALRVPAEGGGLRVDRLDGEPHVGGALRRLEVRSDEVHVAPVAALRDEVALHPQQESLRKAAVRLRLSWMHQLARRNGETRPAGGGGMHAALTTERRGAGRLAGSAHLVRVRHADAVVPERVQIQVDDRSCEARQHPALSVRARNNCLNVRARAPGECT
jgi:hypothetical protein